jgi:hypothetical protein
VNVIEYWVRGDERKRHAVLVPLTRYYTAIVMWFCGYTARAPAWRHDDLALHCVDVCAEPAARGGAD